MTKGWLDTSSTSSSTSVSDIVGSKTGFRRQEVGRKRHRSSVKVADVSDYERSLIGLLKSDEEPPHCSKTCFGEG